MQKRILGQFKFKVVNSDSANAKVFCIMPGMFDRLGLTYSGADYDALAITHHRHNTATMVAAGYSVDCIADDGNVALTGDAVTVTALNSRFSVRHFIDSLAQMPLLCSELTIQADNVDMFEETIVYKRDSAFKGLGEDFINLADSFDTSQNQDNKINVVEDFILSGQTIMYVNIPAGRTVTFGFNNLKAL